MYSRFLILLLTLIAIPSFAQIPIEHYRTKIKELKTKTEYNAFWDSIVQLDQQVLMKTGPVNKFDSLSIDLMVRTALMFEQHGVEAYNVYSPAPVLNFVHSSVSESLLAFWPIITDCVNAGDGAITQMGGGFPAYQLESISLSFYSYSLFQKDDKYPALLEKLNQYSENAVIPNLLKAFEKHKAIQALQKLKTLNSWYVEELIGLLDERTFSIVILEDDALYVTRSHYRHKLNLVTETPSKKIYRIENEPFGWSYELGTTGDLKLLDQFGNVLMAYTQAEK